MTPVPYTLAGGAPGPYVPRAPRPMRGPYRAAYLGSDTPKPRWDTIKMPVVLACKHCGEPFERLGSSSSTFCSRSHAAAFSRGPWNPHVKRVQP